MWGNTNPTQFSGTQNGFKIRQPRLHRLFDKQGQQVAFGGGYFTTRDHFNPVGRRKLNGLLHSTGLVVIGKRDYIQFRIIGYVLEYGRHGDSPIVTMDTVHVQIG
jgi:hypothetical protein